MSEAIRPLLIIMNPRRIAGCLNAIADLAVDKLWLVAMTEHQISLVLPALVQHAKERGYTHGILLSDDTMPTRVAFHSVTRQLTYHPVVTGYCNLDASLPYVNLTKTPFKFLDRSVGDDYSFMTHAEAQSFPMELVPTYFAGACLTGMSLELWEKYPFQAIGSDGGYASDWSLSTRLQRDGVPIVAPRSSFIHHVKERWCQRDQNPEKRLLIGEIEPKIVWHFETAFPH